MTSKVVAHTKLGPIYPGFINITPMEDGGVTIHLRGDPVTRKAAYVCGFERDRGKHGRCTPGDDRCNNYCNNAPEKGPMQKHPKPCDITDSGKTTSLVLSAAEWADLKAQIAIVDP